MLPILGNEGRIIVKESIKKVCYGFGFGFGMASSFTLTAKLQDKTPQQVRSDMRSQRNNAMVPKG
jgi:hypothetical protein